ncbi:GroES-like protein [Periconia macrospinosa]|uniref:GroES-like protein n=1 Tax=Periconia macrospinosa TaxID=97972 RepID=A0A2V1E1C7_9PLEO|nr:GroES-like protein [Periconia macrospinosa]
MTIPSSFKGGEISTPKSRISMVNRRLPTLGLNEVGIKITATAINPVDWKMRDYDASLEGYPAVLGSDAAGVVAAIGPDVKNLLIGDRVFFQGIVGTYESSTFQQYCKMPAELVSKTPKNITDDEAAGVSLAAMAAVTALYSEEGHGIAPPWTEGGRTVGKGKAIVIIGGASSVGRYAIQLARLSGYERIISNASATNREFIEKLGAHVVLDRSESTPEAFHSVVGDYHLDFVFDGISVPSTQKLGVQILQTANVSNGHLVTVHIVVPDVPSPEAVALGQNQEPRVEIRQVLGIGSFPALRFLSEPFAKFMGGDEGYIAQGLFTPNRPHVVPGGLSGIEDALELNKKGVSGKKIIIRPFDS